MKPFRLSDLDRNVLVLTFGVWAVHYFLRTSLMMFLPEQEIESGVLLARLIASSLGVVLCLLMHLWFRRRREHKPWRLLLQAAALSIPAGLLQLYLGEQVFMHFTDYYLKKPDRWMHPMELIETYKYYQWIFFAWCGLYAAATTVDQVRRRDTQLAAAHSAAQQAQLQALRLQIHPHFLFNTLNTLAGLIALGRNAASEQMVLNLSKFLRYTLSSPPSQFVTVQDEVRALRMYLDIETARFSDRLQVVFDIADDCEHSPVPSLILLPLVENALKYGLRDSETGIVLRVGARRDGATLVLSVQDDGAEKTVPAPAMPGGLGIGLQNVEQRLQGLFGDDASLQVGPLPRGWRSEIRMPWQEAPR